MNFNGDISKIPLPSYPIPGLSDLIEELPQTGPAHLQAIPPHHERHEPASRMLNTQMVDTYTTGSADHRNPSLDPSLLDVMSAPNRHAVHNRPPEVYNRRNLAAIPTGLNNNLSHLGQFVASDPAARTSIAAQFPPDPVVNALVTPHYPGSTSRLPVTRPVQAVAPQPRNPRLSENAEVAEGGRVVDERKSVQTPGGANDPAQQEENPKIRLKIRRTKKSHKKEKHPNKHSSEYGIVSSESKPEGVGPIKLKFSRLKSPSSGDSVKIQPHAQAFKVSSLTTANPSTSKAVSSESHDQSKAENEASAMARAMFKDKKSSAHSHSGSKKVESSPVQKSSHKHRSHKSSTSSSSQDDISKRSQFTPSQFLQQGYGDPFHNPIVGNQNPNIPQPNVLPSNKKSLQKQGDKKASSQHQKPSNVSSSYGSSFNQLDPAFQSASLTHQKQLPGQFFSQVDPHTQQMIQKHFMTSQFPPTPQHPNSMMPQLNRNTSTTQDNRQSSAQSSFTSPKVWDARTQDIGGRNYRESSKMPDFGYDARPPPYTEAILVQQRAQAQLYQSLNRSMTQPQDKMRPAEQQPMQQQQPSVPPPMPQQRGQPDLQKMQMIQQQNEILRKQNQPQQTQHLTPSAHLLNNSPKTSFHDHMPVHTGRDVTASFKQKQHLHESSIKNVDRAVSQQQAVPTPHPTGMFQPNVGLTATTQMYPPKSQQSESHNRSGNVVNYMNAPAQSRHRSSLESKSKKKPPKSSVLQHVRVKFIADDEEADIYKLKDIMYPDDTEVASFEDLHPGMDVVAKWPMNGKLYAAIVIDPLDNSGRRFRERKPPPKPFQAQPGSARKKQHPYGPSVVLNKLAKHDLPPGLLLSDPLPEAEDGFNAYSSMADKIKLKRRERLAKEAKQSEGRKRKRESSGDVSNLINVRSDESDEDYGTPSRKRSHQSDTRKKERRRAAEMRLHHEDGAVLFQRFISMVKMIFDDMDSVDPRIIDEVMNSKEEKVPPCLLISKSRLHELNGETAKLKAMGMLNQLPKKMLVRLLTALEPSIRNGINVKPLKIKGNTSEEQKWNRECGLDRVGTATAAALVVMNVMTARFMPKAVYIDDVIDCAAQLLRQQLNNTIYPEYDLVYKTPSHSGKKKGPKELTSTASTRMKRAHYKGTKNRGVLQLYNKLNILLNQMVELVDVQPLTDTSILKISSLGISPFFVENVRELQLSAIRLTTSIFSRYDKHRSLILEDIFQSLARLPTSKRNLRSYRLTYVEDTFDSSDEEDTSGGKKKNVGGTNTGELQHIQMVTALVLQMIHAITHLPTPELPDETLPENEKKIQSQVDEMKVITSYDMAVRTGQNFLSVFLKKCASKSEEIDYRPLFENLVHDLLATVNKPEWPASEMLLSILGRLLVHTFSTKSTEMSLRVASLDYLGVVAAKLRHDAVTSRIDVTSVESLLKRLEEAVNEHQEKDLPVEEVKKENEVENKTEAVIEQEKKKVPKRGKRKSSKKVKSSKASVQSNCRKKLKIKAERSSVENEEDRLTSRLQYLLLGYLRRNVDADPALLFAHNFYIGQWLRDVSQQFQQLQQHSDQGGDAGEQLDAQSRELQACQKKKDKLMDLAFSASVATSNITIDHAEDGERKKPLKLSELQENANKLAAGLTVEDAALVSRHLASTRPFSRAFDRYLSYILRVRDEPAVALRTRAIKCLAEVVAVDPSIMERDDISQGVQTSLVDPSTSVREAAIDLVGKFILLKPELVKHYYNMLIARILDTGVSVRKRVIRILRDLFHEYPDLPQLTDACVKMIRRVNDEEGIKKLVHEVFMKMWFSPVNSQDTKSLRKKALLITDIVAANRERGYEWIEQLFKNLIDTKTESPRVEEACRQIVDCLVEHVIIFENPQNKQNEANDKAENMEADESATNAPTKTPGTESSADKAKKRSIRLVATVQTLVQLARIRPRLLVPHVMTLQPYLATKCETPDDVLTVHGICRTLELAIPLMEHPSEAFLSSIEEDMMRITLTQRFHVVSAAVACLGAVTCRVTLNYRLIWDCFQRMCTGLSNARAQHQNNPQSIFHPKHYRQLLRTLFIIGHFAKNFDFDDENIKGKTQICVKDKVYDCLYYFTTLPTTPTTEEMRGYSIAALGLLMVQDPNMMFRSATRELYKSLLDVDQKSDCLKKQVLQNLQSYLQMEDVKMQEAAEASAKKAKQEEEGIRHDESMQSTSGDAVADEDIKEICDVSSGMASSVMQLFLKQVLEAFFHRNVTVRHAALHTVYLTLQQGLVHPVQCVPYLIAAASDPDSTVHKEADQQLVDLNKRYHGFVHTKALQGMRLAYQLQSYVQPTGHVVRGFLESSIGSLDDGSGTTLKASCSQLYQLVRPDKKHRRALLLSLLHLFDDTVKTDLQLLVFVADNLAYFPYHTLDEPLFLISQIEVYVSVSGSNVLQSFKESLRSKKSRQAERLERRAAKLKKREEKRLAKEAHLSDSSDSSSSSSSSSSESSSEDDDSDDEGSIESRLPVNDEAIEEFAQLSLACLLLLWLKHHLKTLFGFTDNKIHKYSPTETNRANDKQCHRRRPDLRFDPKPALDHIVRVRKQMSCRHPDYIGAIAKQYAEFNELMNKLDPNEDDTDSDKEKATPAKNANAIPAEAPAKEGDEMEESDRDTDDETKPAATLDAIRQSTALKSKKRSKHRKQEHRGEHPIPPPEMRKRAPIHYMESSSESEEDFRGF